MKKSLFISMIVGAAMIIGTSSESFALNKSKQVNAPDIRSEILITARRDSRGEEL